MGTPFNEALLQRRAEAALNDLGILLGLEHLFCASTIDYKYEITANGIALVGEISLSSQLSLPFDETDVSHDEKSQLSKLIQDRNALNKTAHNAQGEIDRVCSAVLNATKPLAPEGRLQPPANRLGPWVIGNQGRQLPLTIDGDIVNIEVPSFVDFALDPALRNITGYIGDISIDHFRLLDVEDPHGLSLGEARARSRGVSVHISPQQSDKGCLMWLAAARTQQNAVRFTAQAYKRHFSNSVMRYHLTSWSKEEYWKQMRDSLPNNKRQ
jgi:hypothetical protein